MLTLRFVPYGEIAELSSLGRIKKLLDLVKDDNIVLLQGRLKKEEETELIKTTMEEINNKFRGIELAVINPAYETKSVLNKLREGFVNVVLGERQGMTIIGPASVIKEIKKNPEKIELFTIEAGSKKAKKKSRKKR